MNNSIKTVHYILSHRTINSITPGTLTVAAYTNFYPVSYKLPNSTKISGLDVDIMELFCKAADIKLKLIPINTWDGLWDYPIKKKSDTSIGGIANTAKRTHTETAWSIPYFYVLRTAIYNKSNPILKFPTDVTGTVRGTYQSTGWLDAELKMVKSKKRKFLEKGIDDTTDIQDLRAGKIQGLMRGSFVGVAIVKKYPKELSMTTPWQIDPSLVPSDGEVFAFPCNKNSGLAELLSCFIVQLIFTGQLDKLIRKWKLTE